MAFSSSTLKLPNDVRSRLAENLSAVPPEKTSFVLDGTGVNGALQYAVLSMVGMERLNRFAKVHVISASTYTYLCFLAFHRQALTWDRVRLSQWSRFNNECHQVNAFKGVAKTLKKILGASPSILTGEGLRKSLQGTVSASFFAQKIGDLPANACFWLYDLEEKALLQLTPRNEWADVPISVLIQAAPAVPKLFAPMHYKGRSFIDPVYSPLAARMYKTIATDDEVAQVIMSNMHRSGVREKTHYICPHSYGNGHVMILKDFARFLLGLPNPRMASAVDIGLFNTEII